MAILTPDWHLPEGVTAFYSSRQDGVSEAGFSRGNMAMHVGDNPAHVAQNRQLLPQSQRIFWLDQVHSAYCVQATASQFNSEPVKADASFTFETNLVCAVMTADCVPILLCHQSGNGVAAVHAGWRGLASGVLENTFKAMGYDGNEMLVWIGPHIRQANFEVGGEVKTAFSNFPEAFSTSEKPGYYQCDMAAIVKRICADAGVKQVADCGLCTYQQEQLFFSHRRSSKQQSLPTGRMVSGIFIR